jgi:3-dehydro-L-gulonate 2-dehydrogenase
MTAEGMLRVAFDDLCATLAQGLSLRGFEDARAQRCAEIFAENSLVGVASHGLNRFPRFVEWIDNGWVDPGKSPMQLEAWGSLERWDGQLGPGPLNAEACMGRAMAIAKEFGAGIVALRNTNHWMRGGTYAWQAADAGFAGLCFTNTEPNLPPWGSSEPKLGNNPVAVSIPRSNGRHLLFDGAMSQFSYGALETAARAGRTMPVPGGYTRTGELTDDPGQILNSKRALPIGFWKGAGLSLMLDLLAASLSAGNTTKDLGMREGEYGVSQLFLALGSTLLDAPTQERIERTLQDLHSAATSDKAPVRYPGEHLLGIRERNLREGVPVEAAVWNRVQQLADVQ